MGFLLANWKIAAGAAAIAAVFLAGWKVNGWRYEAEYAEAFETIQEQLAERRTELLVEFEETRQTDQAARAAMSSDLSALRARNDELQDQVDSTLLVKSEPEIVVQWRERIVREEIDETCGPPVLANPFGPEFVRLYNESSDQRSGSVPGADPAG